MMIKKAFGWIRDIPDQRDYLYKAIKPVIRVPGEQDLSRYCSVVEDQGRLGSCTAQALAGNLEFLDNMPDNTYTDVSRLFIYYNERELMGTVEYDSGASLRDGIKSLKNMGSCRETMWPYVVKRFTDKPTAKCYEEALGHRIESYHRINSLTEMLTCLAEGYPFVFGFTVYESFMDAKVARTGIAQLPEPGERVLGGHAVMAAGYSRKDERFLVRNSWGTGWGLKGYFTMPFEYLETLAADFWTIRR